MDNTFYVLFKNDTALKPATVEQFSVVVYKKTKQYPNGVFAKEIPLIDIIDKALK